jgi:hypothetical protein
VDLLMQSRNFHASCTKDKLPIDKVQLCTLLWRHVLHCNRLKEISTRKGWSGQGRD